MSPRPFNEKDLITNINGSPVYLGMLVSTGSAVNNATTTTAFNSPPLGPSASDSGPINYTNTLAGKTLLLQTSAAGLILPSSFANMVIGATPGGVQPIIALQAVVPPAAGTVPGVALTSGERVVIIMGPSNGWLQWLPVSGSANCLVWELQ